MSYLNLDFGIPEDDVFVYVGSELFEGRTPENDGHSASPTDLDLAFALNASVVLGLAKMDSDIARLLWFRIIGIIFYRQGQEEARLWVETAKKRLVS